MDVQQLEFQLPDLIEQILSGAGLMYFTYNRGITVSDSTITAQIELKGSKHAFKITLVYDRSSRNATVSVNETDGEAPAGNADKIVNLISALPTELRSVLA